MKQNENYPGVVQAIWLCLAVVGLQFSLSIPIAVAGFAFKRPLVEHPAIVGVVNLVSFTPVLLWGIRRSGAPVQDILPLGAPRAGLMFPIVLTIFGMGILLSEADNLFRTLFPAPVIVARFFNQITRPQAGEWASYLAIVIVPPLTEECLFRGLILRGLLRRHSGGTAVLVTAVLFGLTHLNPWQFSSAMGLGAVLGWWFWRTQSLAPCLLGHALLNGWVLANPHLPFAIPGFNRGNLTRRLSCNRSGLTLRAWRWREPARGSFNA